MVTYRAYVAVTRDTLTGNIQGTIDLIVNGQTVDTQSNSCTATQIESYKDYTDWIPNEIEIRGTSVSKCSGAATFQVRLRLYKISGGSTTLVSKNVNLSGSWTGKSKIVYNPRNVETTPTYFETLDKLDQWSSAQYIPNSGNKLNL